MSLGPLNLKKFVFRSLTYFRVSPIFCDFAQFFFMFHSLVHGYYIYVGFLAQICRLHWSISFFLTALLTENLVKSVNADILLHSRYANMQINSMICISSDYKYDAIFGELVCRDASILICLVCCYS